MRFRNKYLIFFFLILIIFSIKYVFFNESKMSFNSLISEEIIINKDNIGEDTFNTGIFILTDNINDYSGVYLAFKSVGYSVTSGDFNDYEKNNLYNMAVVFPEESLKKLPNEKIRKIKENIEKGQKAIIIGKSQLATDIGINVSYKKKVSSYKMNDHKDQIIEIKNGMSSYKFDTPKNFKSIAKNVGDSSDIMIVGSVKKGKVIYSGSSLAPKKGEGYEYYPLFLEVFCREFNLKPALSRNNGGVYVDIAYHIGIDTPKELARRVKMWGCNQVNIGIWASLTKENKEYYKNIISECHNMGIKVFAWVELPMVSIDFWNAYPKWRQKTASGKDAKIDWRYLMALENEECFNAVKADLKNRINMFDFDGIDIAEIYYESPGKGFKDKSIFTPMSDSFRKEFKMNYGFDPKEVFNKASKYYWKIDRESKNKLIEERVRLVTKQNREMIELADEIKKEKSYFETSLTIIDSIADKRMRENIGLDSNEIIKLQDKYDFILNIEDPFTLWGLGSKRYSIIGKEYKDVIDKNKKLYIDINIVERYGKNYPTSKQRGIELYSLIYNASKYTDKVMMYSLSTPNKLDMILAPYAHTYDVKSNKILDGTYEFEAKSNFLWNIDMKGKKVYINGDKYPLYSENYIIIPSGKNRVEVITGDNKNNKIVDINGEIITSYYEDDKIILNYSSNGRGFITLNKKPKSIAIDDKIRTLIIKENKGLYTIYLPSGRHKLVIE